MAIAHKTIKKVTEDIEHGHFNTAIAAMMEAVNGFYKVQEAHQVQQSAAWRFAIESILQLVAPFAPHMAEELWQSLGNTDTVHADHWPEWDESLLKSDTVIIVVQVNGKLRAQLELPDDSSEAAIIKAAEENEKVASYLKDKKIKKTIYIPGKLANFVTN